MHHALPHEQLALSAALLALRVGATCIIEVLLHKPLLPAPPAASDEWLVVRLGP